MDQKERHFAWLSPLREKNRVSLRWWKQLTPTHSSSHSQPAHKISSSSAPHSLSGDVFINEGSPRNARAPYKWIISILLAHTFRRESERGRFTSGGAIMLAENHNCGMAASTSSFGGRPRIVKFVQPPPRRNCWAARSVGSESLPMAKILAFYVTLHHTAIYHPLVF